MLKRFAQLLFAPPEETAKTSADRVRVATCVILLEAATADSAFTAEERRHIVDVLRSRFDLDPGEADELLQQAQAARHESTDLWRFTNEINKAFSHQEKLDIVEDVWRIFYTDGTLDGHEDYLAHKLRHLLNLNHPQLIQAKLKVLAEVRGETK